MKSGQKLRWGILGCGKIASKFAEDMRISKTGIIVACAARDAERAGSFAAQYDIPLHFGDYNALAKCQEVDVVYIATTHNFHEEHAIICMQHGKHVLCEKPLAVNLAQTISMQEMAQRNRVFLMEALWTAFLPAIVKLKEDIRSGIIGEIRHIRADFGFKVPYDPASRLFNPALAGGSLLDIGIYPLFMATWLCGMPDKILAIASKAPSGVDNECSVLLRYPDNCSAFLYATVTCHTDTTCEIFGTQGKITIPSRFHEQHSYILSVPEMEDEVTEAGILGRGYVHEIDHVHDCLKAGLTESPVMTHLMSRQIASLMDQIRSLTGITYPFE